LCGKRWFFAKCDSAKCPATRQGLSSRARGKSHKFRPFWKCSKKGEKNKKNALHERLKERKVNESIAKILRLKEKREKNVDIIFAI
jgi:hypothetical protein